MSKISKDDLREIVQDILFENHIKEMFTPDNFVNSRTAMFDTPGPNTGSEVAEEQDIIIPLTADDFVSMSTLKRNHSARDKDYSPANRRELKSALYSTLEDYDDEQINSDISVKIWKSVTKILSKV
tara:strand:+ start:108 stop:485 length:378 start_codon:yes stop_codon:yes gene_type:complete